MSRIAEVFKFEMEGKNREYEIFQESFMNTGVMKILFLTISSAFTV